MYPPTHQYEIRILDITGLRNVFTPVIRSVLQEWNREHIPWAEDVECATDWLFKDMIARAVTCPVIDHYESDLGRYLLAELKELEFHFTPFTNQLRQYTRERVLKHVKILMVGSTVIVALLPY